MRYTLATKAGTGGTAGTRSFKHHSEILSHYCLDNEQSFGKRPATNLWGIVRVHFLA
jgi:hypothetical protein